MSQSKEKRMILDTGYEVMQSVQIGGREIVIAENMAEPDGMFYMKAEYTGNGILGIYDRIIYSSEYLAVIKEFICGIDRQISSLRNEIEDFQAKPIVAAECRPYDYSQSITDKIIVIKPEALCPEYRRGDRQLMLVDGGFGAVANARGNAVICTRLSDGQSTRFERWDILGEIKVLPEWAKEKLAEIKAEQKARSELVANEPEKVNGYAITERIQVGKKQFVFGENPEAPSPYVTWQSTEGRSGYDLGHYFLSRDKALNDLHSRADRERKNNEPDRNHNRKNSKNAR